ncbi:VIR protein [Plasmodium vivax]|uniref:VIR protein n=1 Tax=Plasmodium vivax TaxID=5855 RepID=A0A1G4H761_PLAVI|nr:VIR protein [Plasmodium vivax]
MEEEPSLESEFVKLTKEYDSLKYFYLYKFYTIFNDDSDGEEHIKKCQSFVQVNEDSGGNTVFELCGRLRKNFKNLKETERVVGKNNACEYLKFWFNDQIITYSYNYATINPIVENWATILEDSEIYNTCKGDDILMDYFNDDIISSDSNAFYVMKVIYEYLKGDEGINTTMQNLNLIRNEVKDSYLEDNFHEYEKIKINCSSNSTNSLLCNIYKDCVSRYSNQLSQLENKLSKHRVAQEMSIRWYTTLEEKNRLKNDALASSDGNSELSTSPLTAIIAFICTILGLGLTLISLYKFTPLGTLFRPKTQRKKRTFKNIEEEKGNSMFSNNKYNQRNSTNKKYNLRYHSA